MAGDFERGHGPRGIGLAGELSQFERADAEPDNRGLVQLARDGGRQRQQPRQAQKLVVLLAPSAACCISWLFPPYLRHTKIIQGQI